MSLADFANRLGQLAAGAHRQPGCDAAAVVAQAAIEATLAGHVRTGLAESTTQVIATDNGIQIVGPRYLPFIAGALDFDHAPLRAAYAAEVHKILEGGS